MRDDGPGPCPDGLDGTPGPAGIDPTRIWDCRVCGFAVVEGPALTYMRNYVGHRNAVGGYTHADGTTAFCPYCQDETLRSPTPRPTTKEPSTHQLLDELTRRVQALENIHTRLGPQLGQEWVSRVTTNDAPDVSVIGPLTVVDLPVDKLQPVKDKLEPIPVDRTAITTTTGEPVDVVRARQQSEGAYGQHSSYIVLKPEERAKGFVRPLRRSYKHLTCGAFTGMGRELAETYARDPGFYQGTFCQKCNAHFPLNEFVWEIDGKPVGS